MGNLAVSLARVLCVSADRKLLVLVLKENNIKHSCLGWKCMTVQGVPCTTAGSVYFLYLRLVCETAELDPKVLT